MEGGMNVWLSVAYLAPVHYYARILTAKKIFLEQHDNYLKQTFRNRCCIVTGNGVIPLSIPVDKGGEGGKCLYRDIRFSTHNNWQTLHWRSLVAAYNSSPFFEYYVDDFLPFYERGWQFLFDFNYELQLKMLTLLDIETDLELTDEYAPTYQGGLDLRDSIHPKIEPTSVDPAYQSIRYYQVFESKFGFVPNMSIVDLLFNMGPEAKLVLNKMIQKEE